MLSHEDNELLTRTGPHTPMGSLLRRYWTPALLSEEIPEPDGAPVPVHILGERLVAFRDSSGRVGLLEEHCAHRRASLVFARNEDGGLRCIFHGWKYDATGQCVDMPTEPLDSPACAKVRLRAYPTREAAGIVWAYLGPGDRVPPFPRFDWTELPPARCRVWKILHECNYAQALERDIDWAHVPIAHRKLSEAELAAGKRLGDFSNRDFLPRIEVQATDFGVRSAAVREIDGGRSESKVTCFVLPHYLLLPHIQGHKVAMAFVPRDDQSNWHFLVRFNPEQDIDLEHYAESRGLRTLDAGFRKRNNRDNRFLQDRALMRAQRSFNGIAGYIMEDHVLAEIQDPILDRTRERLGSTDGPVIALRERLLAAMRANQAGEDPPGTDPAFVYEPIKSATLVTPQGVTWQERMRRDSVPA